MIWPREGSREIDQGIIVSEAMDWCNSPSEPVPYRIWARQVQAADLANSVRQTDERSHVEGSIVLASFGDEPGVGGGVISRTQGAECTPKTWSETVRAEGRNMVRHDDEWWMNHRNTYGRLTYVEDQNSYPTPAPRSVQAALTPTPAESDATRANAGGIQQAQWWGPLLRLAPEGGIEGMPRLGPRSGPLTPPRAAPEPAPEPMPMPGPRPPAPGLRTTGKCRPITVCFESNGKDAEYRRQLKFQQDALNAKSACQARDDIDSFDNKTETQKDAQRAVANKAKGPFIVGWSATHPGQSITGLDALHRLDMVAGGNPTDFADMGDNSVNRSIGPEWKADSRKGELKRYADKMCERNCPMSVTLDLCKPPPIDLTNDGTWA